jgi:putative N-acetylmannosamine-6-phosphate epimerase
LLHDVAWCYEDPAPEVAGIAGMVAFFNERVDAICVDGEERPRPVTTWSHFAAPRKHNTLIRGES